MKNFIAMALVGLLALLSACGMANDDTDSSTIQPVVIGDGQAEFLAGTYNAESGVVRLTHDAVTTLQSWDLSLMTEGDSQVITVTSHIAVGAMVVGEGLSIVDADNNIVGYLTIESHSWVNNTDEADVSSFFPGGPIGGACI